MRELQDPDSIRKPLNRENLHLQVHKFLQLYLLHCFLQKLSPRLHCGKRRRLRIPLRGRLLHVRVEHAARHHLHCGFLQKYHRNRSAFDDLVFRSQEIQIIQISGDWQHWSDAEAGIIRTRSGGSELSQRASLGAVWEVGLFSQECGWDFWWLHRAYGAVRIRHTVCSRIPSGAHPSYFVKPFWEPAGQEEDFRLSAKAFALRLCEHRDVVSSVRDLCWFEFAD